MRESTNRKGLSASATIQNEQEKRTAIKISIRFSQVVVNHLSAANSIMNTTLSQ